MWRLLKYLIYLIVLAFIVFVAYAYVAPLLGQDFTPPTGRTTQTITLPIEN